MENKIKTIIDMLFSLAAKHYFVLLVSFFSAFYDGYSKRKIVVMKWHERVIDFFAKWIVGGGLSILVTSTTDNKYVIVALTAAITIGGEQIASWIGNNISSLLTKLADGFIGYFFKDKVGNDSEKNAEQEDAK